MTPLNSAGCGGDQGSLMNGIINWVVGTSVNQGADDVRGVIGRGRWRTRERQDVGGKQRSERWKLWPYWKGRLSRPLGQRYTRTFTSKGLDLCTMCNPSVSMWGFYDTWYMFLCSVGKYRHLILLSLLHFLKVNFMKLVKLLFDPAVTCALVYLIRLNVADW